MPECEYHLQCYGHHIPWAGPTILRDLAAGQRTPHVKSVPKPLDVGEDKSRALELGRN